MSTNYNAKPINAPNITRPGESLEHVGSRNVTSLLPSIFQTSVNKQFLDSTLEQLLTSGSTEAISAYVGNRNTNASTEQKYIGDHLNFVPGIVNKNASNDITNTLTYKDLLNALKFNETNIKNKSGILDEQAYTLDLPINYDMFTNYHNYHFLVDELPIADLQPMITDPIVIDDIVGKINYTTPTLKNGKTLTFGNGMRVRFSPYNIKRYSQTVPGNTTFAKGAANFTTVKVYLNNALQTETTDYTIVGSNIIMNVAPAVKDEVEVHCFWVSGTNYNVDDVYIVDGVGHTDGIKFTKQFTADTNVEETGERVWFNQTIYTGKVPTRFDADDSSFEFTAFDKRELRMIARDYIVEERWSQDQSAWARSNLWIHEQDAIAVCTYTGDDVTSFITEANRAIRPIIEFRANIEKFSFGKNHILNVTHILDDIVPSAIIGETSWDLASAIVTNTWTTKGYNLGDYVKFVQGNQTTYWNCIKTHGEAKDPTYFENSVYWAQVSIPALENGDTILFITPNDASRNKIYTVGGVGTSITLTETYNTDGSNSAIQIQKWDKVLVKYGYNDVKTQSYVGDIYSGSEWFWNGSAWLYGQQKDHRSEAPLFQLYDMDLAKLNATKYDNSTFRGDPIFDYDRGTGTFDGALGFSPVFTDYGNNPGFQFKLGLGAIRYEYSEINTDVTYQSNTGAGKVEEIPGYYYYKDLSTEKYYNGWKTIRSGQPVRRHIRHIISDVSADLEFELGTTNLYKEDTFDVVLENGGFALYSSSSLNTSTRLNRISDINPVIYLGTGKTYYFTTNFDPATIEFVNRDGTANTGITATLSGNTYTVTLSATVTEPVMYRLTTDNTINGIIIPTSDSETRNVEIYQNGNVITNYTMNGSVILPVVNKQVNDIIDIYYTTEDAVTKGNSLELPADTHVYNAQNQWLTHASFGDIQNHIKSQMTSIPNFTGEYFGINNYRNIIRAHDFGGTIRQQPFSTELIGQTLMDVDTNPFSSLKYVAQSYRRFKTQFLQKVFQLNKTMSADKSVYEIVDRALEEINVGKKDKSAFANSNMAMFKNYESSNYVWTSNETAVFNLPKTINTYDDASNHIQVWVKDYASGSAVWIPLTKESGYTLSDYQITITQSINYNPTNNSSEVYIRWYPQDAVSFVPPSAAKLGFVKPHTPTLIGNYDIGSLGTSTSAAFICHDGSIHSRTGTELYDRNAAGFSIEDAALWDLENRIYNNLDSRLDTVEDYRRSMPSRSNTLPYTWSELTQALETEFNKWKVRNSITDLQSDSYYDASNPFTWNYRDTVGIGGYKGVYTYYFNTYRPHTHPWEMFGYNKQPSWWATNYSWTDPVKRAALIQALKYGHYNDPSETALYDLSYSYKHYDWDNDTLVTTAGVLNDPVAANVSAVPATPFKEFVFGDWGQVESVWRDSSEYTISLAIGLMRLRPLWVINTYFRSANRKRSITQDIPTPQYYFSDTKLLGNNRAFEFSYSSYGDAIVESVQVKNGGTGYTSAPALTVYSNFGTGATTSAIISGGSIVAVKVVAPGKNYQSKPTVVASTGTADFDVSLLDGAKKYFLGLSNAVIEYARYNSTTIDNLKSRFENLQYNPIVNINGFTNPNNQEFILESSQGKGRVVVPEENRFGALHLNQPSEEIFFGGVQITPLGTGYKITGYDNSKQYFEYYTPNVGSRKTIVTAGNTTVSKYASYNPTVHKLYYNTVLNSIQDVYSFILGYGEYLKTNGWIGNWAQVGANFAIWASSDSTVTTFYGIPDPRSIQVNEGSVGYFDNINNKYDGVYNLLDKYGKQILPNRVIVSRELLNTDSPITTITAKDNETFIYGIRLYKVSLEHVIVFDNMTDFSDVLYKPELGQMHKRIIWRGSRTKNWNGKLYSPGYIVDGNTIINNFDTTAREPEEFYKSRPEVNNSQLIDVARFNTGYNKPSWANYLPDVDDNTIYEFVKGNRKYKGTRFSLNAFMRNTSIFGGVSNANIYEEWALRTADYGDTRSRNTIEFQVTSDLVKTSPQPIRLFSEETSDLLTDISIDIDNNSSLLVSGEIDNNFVTRPARIYNNNTLEVENVYAQDFVTAGLPLTTETDYRVINRDDFKEFPNPAKESYNFFGDWQDIKQWDSNTSYKFNDKVIYNGHVWEMIDPDGSSGISRINDPITVTGTITLPTIPSTGQTLIVNGTTVNLQKTATTVSNDLINVTATNDIGSSAVVPHGSTLILGTSSSNNSTITFSNIVNTFVYNDIVKTGTVANPTIQGSATKSLIIDNNTVSFNDTVTTNSNITALVAYENAFNTSWTVNNSNAQISTGATNRINAIEALRVGYTNAQGPAQWQAFLTNYYSQSDAGLYIDLLVIEYGAGGLSYSSQMAALVQSDVEIINNILNTSYVANDVLTGVTTIPAGDITSARNALLQGSYVVAIKNWLINNINTVFNTNTIITTASGTEFKLYQLADIVQEINSAGISNVTASAVNNQLRLTKTTSTPTSPFTLRISSASANAEVGFNTGTEIINATGNNVQTTPNLTIAQVVEQINATQITGITAQALAPSGLLLNILSSNNTLYVGNGSANTIIGLTTGVTPATTSVTTVNTAMNINDIVEVFNNANIPNVTASNISNKLRLTSTASTLVIGSGTANGSVGLTAQTYTATASNASNVFNAFRTNSNGQTIQVFKEMEHDPNLFSIWIADNSTKSTINAGYQVLQTMDFGMYISRACAGITDADDAEISVALATGPTQAHNLIAGDYVFITGSDTVPNIDGVHQVSSVDTGDVTKFYIDTYIEKEGTVGNIYPLRKVRFSNYTQLLSEYNTTVNGVYKYNFTTYRQNNEQTPIYAFVDDNNSGIPAVYRWTGSFDLSNGHYGSGGWNLVRAANVQARNDLIENVKIYNAERQTLITTIETYDPAKGIIPGYISEEIDFKLTADIASYNFTSIDGYVENNRAWGNDYVGKRWWDLTTAIYLDYEQGSIDYQQSNWGRLFDGASIDIYEWTRSPVLPEQWEDIVKSKTIIDGKEASGIPYSRIIDGEEVYQWTEMNWYNPKTKSTESQYFFWVKNKTNYNGLRDYTVSQLAAILQNPNAFDLTWCAASGSSNLFITNLENFVSSDSVVQVNQIYADNTLPLTEWTLLSDGDPTSVIPEYFHIKIRDSLAGYNRDSKRYAYSTYSNVTVYNKDSVVTTNNEFYISLANNNLNNDPTTDTTDTYWKKVIDYTLPVDTPISDIDILRSQPVPDIRLHKYNRYGHLTRPVQSLYRDLISARQNFVEAANELLKSICVVGAVKDWNTYLDTTFVEGEVTYDLNKYWTYTDWYAADFDPDTTPDNTYDTYADMIPVLGDPIIDGEGSYVLVRNSLHSDGMNRPEMYRIDIDPVRGLEYVLVWRSKGTIQLSEELWYQSKYGKGFDNAGFDLSGFDDDASNIISKLMDILRENIFVGTNKVLYNKLWFKLLYQAVTDNTTDDFAFKTTYIKLDVDHPFNLNAQTYQERTVDVVEDFVNSIKPFHTKIRTTLEKATAIDSVENEITELERQTEITIQYNDHSAKEWAADFVLDGGAFTAWVGLAEPFMDGDYVDPGYAEVPATDPGFIVESLFTTNDDISEFVEPGYVDGDFVLNTVSGDFEFVYDGNNFQQPAEEGFGDELWPGDFGENLRVRVQTNTVGSVEDVNTRTFQMSITPTYQIEEGIAIVDTAKTTLQSNISDSDTDIEVTNATTLLIPTWDHPGVVWIGTERIEFHAIDGNTLRYCVRGTHLTSAQSHIANATVIDGTYVIPAEEDFRDYGDNLRAAYNDRGISLANAGNTPEHAFIRNAGKGTL